MSNQIKPHESRINRTSPNLERRMLHISNVATPHYSFFYKKSNAYLLSHDIIPNCNMFFFCYSLGDPRTLIKQLNRPHERENKHDP
jgi:hypothetical protein